MTHSRLRYKVRIFLAAIILLLFGANASAKVIQSKSLNIAKEIFFFSEAIKIMVSGDTQNITEIFSYKLNFMGKFKYGKTTQRSWVGMDPTYILITVNYAEGISRPSAISISRSIEDVPFNEIRYLAFDSKRNKDGTKDFFMGDHEKNSIIYRNTVRSYGISNSKPSQVIWLISKIR